MGLILKNPSQMLSVLLFEYMTVLCRTSLVNLYSACLGPRLLKRYMKLNMKHGLLFSHKLLIVIHCQFKKNLLKVTNFTKIINHRGAGI